LYIDSVHICIQFQDVGSHGTKVVVYNLWMNDDGLLELDFEDDDEVSVHIFLHCNYTMALHIVLVVCLYGSNNRNTSYCILSWLYFICTQEASEIRHVKYNSKICYRASYLVSFDLYCPRLLVINPLKTT